MNKDYPDNSDSNFSNTEVSVSFSLERILDISANVKHGKSTLKLKPNKLYIIKLGGGDFAIIRTLKDNSVRYVIHDNNGLFKGDL